jgi:hypothetical protein
MGKLTKRRKILRSIAGGIGGGVILWLLNFIPWFHIDDFSWRQPVAFAWIFAIIFYFVILPINDKELAKKEQKLSEKEK